MNLSVVIVNYQTYELTKNTIESIFQYDYPFSYEILVVDNASSDDSLARLKEYFKDKVTFIASDSANHNKKSDKKGRLYFTFELRYHCLGKHFGRYLWLHGKT